LLLVNTPAAALPADAACRLVTENGTLDCVGKQVTAVRVGPISGLISEMTCHGTQFPEDWIPG